ncbi:MAG: protein kinase [Planctomycetes bacterium]|nr:protein kinase [Planctomycetota bacterium]
MPVPLHDDPLLAEIPEVDGFKVLEPCVLYAKLGEGGMGAVYRGRHLNLDIDVAVKCLRRSLADQSDAFIQRFQREARLAAGIHHQNLVQVYDVSQKSGVHYLVMEFVLGETARDRVRRKGPLKLAEALRIAYGAASGLAEAHQRRIVHRDVKPDNILIGRDGRVKVSDLGLAKAIEGEVDSSLTQGVMGTPQYMAPEQWEDSSKVTPAADVWALGATLQYLLCGEDPIAVGTLQQVFRRICVEPFPEIRARRPDVPSEVAALIERCVTRDLGQRFADCGQVARELSRLVGRDEGELVSHPGESTTMGATLVSPPPPQTMAKIREQVDTRGDARSTPRNGPAPSRGGDAPRTQRIELQPTQFDPPHPARARSRGLWIGGGALALLGLGIGAWAVFGGAGQPAGGAGPRRGSAQEDPPERDQDKDRSNKKQQDSAIVRLPMSVALDGIPDLRKGYVSGRAEFELTGRVEGWNDSFAVELRGGGGSVDLVDEGRGRFTLELDLARDGRHELVFSGERLEGPKQLVLTLDTLAPVLETRTTALAGPYPAGASVEFALEFDEPLGMAEIGGRVASIDARNPKLARVELNAPGDREQWEIEWRAVDKLDHAASGSFRASIERASLAPVLPQGGGERTNTNSSTGASSSVKLRAPSGCDPFGTEALTIGGVAWAKRIRQRATKIVLVLVPDGTFVQGASSDDARAPAVAITKPFYISVGEVSQAEYAAAMGKAAPDAASADLPRMGLSWNDANEFARKRGFTLPTEAEWEYACRAGSKRAFHFGDALSDAQAATKASGGKLRACGTGQPNAFGLADMHGNVKEFCRDRFATSDDRATPPERDPLGRSGNLRVVRGGSYVSDPSFCTSSARQVVDAARAVADAGLRVTLPLE